MLPRHGAGFDATGEARTHADVGTRDETRDHGNRFAEIVGPIGVAHDDVAAVGSRSATPQCRTIAALVDPYDARAERRGQRLAAVGAAVIGDHDLAH